MAHHKKGRNQKKGEDRRRWNGVSTTGRAKRIASRRYAHKSARRGWKNPARSKGFQKK